MKRNRDSMFHVHLWWSPRTVLSLETAAVSACVFGIHSWGEYAVRGSKATGKQTLEGWADSDFAGDMDTRNSTSGFVFMLNGGAAFLVKQVTAVGWDIDGRSPVHCCESCVVEIYQAQKCVLSSGLGESSMGSNIAGIRED